MKKLFRKICAMALILIMVSGSVPAYALEMEEKVSTPCYGVDKSGEAVCEWLRNGRKGRMPSNTDAESINRSLSMRPSVYALLPESYDVRSKGGIEPVYSQEPFNTCWAIAANVAAGSHIINKFPHMSFCPFHTAHFTYSDNPEMVSWYVDDPYDFGGLFSFAVNTFASGSGPVILDHNIYEAPEFTEEDRYRRDFQVKDSFILEVNNSRLDPDVQESVRNLVKGIIYNGNCVSAAFYSGEISSIMNDETAAVNNIESYEADHEVVIAGWDDSYSRENFSEATRPVNDGAWLVRNSWGTDWGDDGYFWLSYEDKTLEIDGAVELQDNTYDKIYQYDTGVYSDQAGLDGQRDIAESDLFKENTVVATNYTAEEDGVLEAVSFHTTDFDADYSIGVYRNKKACFKDAEGKPAVQEGNEPLKGLHVIELDQPVSLKKGDTFTIVMGIENQSGSYPVSIEVMYAEKGDVVPTSEIGKSYVKNVQNEWEELYSEIEDEDYKEIILDARIKGLVNTTDNSKAGLAEVKFSEMAGPVIEGTELTLSRKGKGDIMYRISPSEDFIKYENPIVPDVSSGSVTVEAYVKNGEEEGNHVSKTYSKAQAELTDFSIETGEDTIALSDEVHFDPEEVNGELIVLNGIKDSFRIKAESADTITINDKILPSGEKITLSLNGADTVPVKVEITGEGRTKSVYEFEVSKPAVSFDTEKENIKYDNSKYTVKDADGNVIENGSNITEYILENEDTEITVETIDGELIWSEYIPGRIAINDVKINYENEETLNIFSDMWRYSFKPDMSEAVLNEKAGELSLVPGKDLYIERLPDEENFRSKIYHLVVPERPAGPEVNAEEINKESITLKKAENAEYMIEGSSWTDERIFKNLKADTEYTFKVRTKASNEEERFRSEETTLKVITKAEEITKPEVKPDKPDAKPDVKPGTDNELKEESHIILNGADQKISADKEGTVSVRLKGEPADLIGVYVNGKLLNSRFYTVTKGSVVVTFTKEYVASLDKGTYELGFMFKNGEFITTSLKVIGEHGKNSVTEEDKHIEVPATGDTNNMRVWILLLVAAVIASFIIIARKKK